MRNGVRWIFATSTLRRDDWWWQQLGRDGKVLKRSRRKFHFLLECIADARKHGYVPDAEKRDKAAAVARPRNSFHAQR